ncbi:MAG: hypothetical protein PHV36_05135 [Elusimicrobiales bacterium]|nr:hypothetical protein [Elusimicrobiales bacterium]
MIKIQAKKNKSKQYVIGGTVAVIVLGLWISLPLMNGSSLDSSSSSANPYGSRAANLSLLGSEFSGEGGAPGSPMSGAMIDNPATSGEDIASSLFQSGPGEEAPAEATADASASAPAVSGSGSGSGSGSAGAPSASGPKGKLSAAASITGGNANSMSSGGKHDKFFGSGNQKSDFAPAAPADLKKMAGQDKRSGLVAMLGNSAEKSSLAAKSGNVDGAKGGASSAFANTVKGTGGTDLNSDLENKSIGAGLQMGQTAQDLKKSDPSLSKTKITPPSKPEDVTDKDEEMKNQIKMMIIKMVLQMALGAVFQGMVPA